MADGIPLGPYVLVRKLAKGGMAEIFLAKKEGPEGFARELVVKRMLPHLTADPTLAELFRAEARIVARMNHPNVVHVYDFGEEGGTGYLVMELVRGVDLRALIERATAVSFRTGREGALPAYHAAKLLSFVCEGLAHAHALGDGLVHRDVTPSNVLVSFDGAVKVADFGVAKLQTGREDTGTGLVRGKFAYLSPEQARGERLDQRSDLFNVGILLFEAVTGEDLFPHDDPREAKLLAAAGRIPDPERIARLGPELARIARRALSSHRGDRYADALEMRKDLETFLRRCNRPSDTVEIGKYVRALFPDVLAADKRGPRAAGTVELTDDLPPGTAPMTEDAVGEPGGFANLQDADTDARTLPGDDASPIRAGAMDVIVGKATQRARARRRRWIGGALAAAMLLSGGVWYVADPGPPTPTVTPLPPLRPPVPIPEAASIRVRTTPSGLLVRVDGDAVGPSPLLHDVPVGGHRVSVWDGEREVAARLIDVQPGDIQEIEFEVDVPGRLHVATRPDAARVFLDDERVGRTPLDLDVVPGEHHMRIEAEGFEPHEERVTIESDAVASISVALSPLAEEPAPRVRRSMRGSMRGPRASREPGLLTISSTPWSAVYLGSRRLGITPLARFSLPAGRHTLTLRAEGRPPRQRVVTIRAGEETRVREVL